MVYFLIGLAICILGLSVFLYVRLNRQPISALFAKIFASLTFILFALFLYSQKSGLGTYSSIGCALFIFGFIASLIGDILLELKIIYPFQQDKYLLGGISSFSIAHIFNICALFLFTVNYTNLFQNNWIALLIILGASIVLALSIWPICTKGFKLNYNKFTLPVNIYSFILIFVTALSYLVTIVIKSTSFIFLPVGFTLFLASDLVLNFQYFGTKGQSKGFTFANHLLYYLAQITLASFIFFM